MKIFVIALVLWCLAGWSFIGYHVHKDKSNSYWDAFLSARFTERLYMFWLFTLVWPSFYLIVKIKNTWDEG